MKHCFSTIILLLVLIVPSGYASQQAITDTGRRVLLNDDGTWVDADKERKPEKKMETNKTKFIRPQQATFLVKSTRNPSAFWIDPGKWTFKKASDASDREYTFRFKDREKNLYGMTVTESVELPLDTLVKIAFDNARAAAPDMKILASEYRNVNGRQVAFLEMNGTTDGLEFTYLGYYYSCPEGSTQHLAYTFTRFADKYRAEMLDFLNGLDVQDYPEKGASEE